MSLGLVVNFFNEPYALPGLIAQAPEMFDEIVFVSSPPDGKTDEESCEIVKASGHKLLHHTVSQGYGILRTWCISQSKCDWVMVGDADERVWASPPLLSVSGSDKWPKQKDPQVFTKVVQDSVDQKAMMYRLIQRAENEGCLAVCLSRRHWMQEPGKWDRPCQDWQHVENDWQLRLVKNSPYLCYDPEVRMHERLVDTRTWESPKYINGSLTEGPFIDHYSVHFKKMDPQKNQQDAETYEELSPGCVKNMWINSQPGVKKFK